MSDFATAPSDGRQPIHLEDISGPLELLLLLGYGVVLHFVRRRALSVAVLAHVLSIVFLLGVLGHYIEMHWLGLDGIREMLSPDEVSGNLGASLVVAVITLSTIATQLHKDKRLLQQGPLVQHYRFIFFASAAAIYLAVGTRLNSVLGGSAINPNTRSYVLRLLWCPPLVAAILISAGFSVWLYSVLLQAEEYTAQGLRHVQAATQANQVAEHYRQQLQVMEQQHQQLQLQHQHDHQQLVHFQQQVADASSAAAAAAAQAQQQQKAAYVVAEQHHQLLLQQQQQQQQEAEATMMMAQQHQLNPQVAASQHHATTSTTTPPSSMSYGGIDPTAAAAMLYNNNVNHLEQDPSVFLQHHHQQQPYMDELLLFQQQQEQQQQQQQQGLIGLSSEMIMIQQQQGLGHMYNNERMMTSCPASPLISCWQGSSGNSSGSNLVYFEQENEGDLASPYLPGRRVARRGGAGNSSSSSSVDAGYLSSGSTTTTSCCSTIASRRSSMSSSSTSSSSTRPFTTATGNRRRQRSLSDSEGPGEAATFAGEEGVGGLLHEREIRFHHRCQRDGGGEGSGGKKVTGRRRRRQAVGSVVGGSMERGMARRTAAAYYHEDADMVGGREEVEGARQAWIECYDEASGCPYYLNQLTGESTWDRPSSFFSSASVVSKGGVTYSSSKGGPLSEDDPNLLLLHAKKRE